MLWKCWYQVQAWHLVDRICQTQGPPADLAQHLILCGPREFAKNIICLSYKLGSDCPSGQATGLEAGQATGLEAGQATGLEAGQATGLEAGQATGLEAGQATTWLRRRNQ